ncbi:MAG: aldehyde ferredoxin oxidoreductase family protein, partial [Thermodesulfobacteriota bacterium]|nr:aldehyde ferredoxin oxidoreductase family protein [Thermodesulfobacteriota bacterium]
VAEPMSKAGYDAVILEGASEEPVYIEISDKEVLFHNASRLWGKNTYETEDIIKDEIDAGQLAVLSIGPAGENLVRFAVLENDYWRSAGRTGVGAVLGSKRVKALAFHGSKNREVYDPQGLDRFVKAIRERGKTDGAASVYRTLGTPMLVSMNNAVGGFPSKYWHLGTFDGWEALSAETMNKQLKTRPRACANCFMACGKLSEVQDGRHKGLKIEGPEYETIYAFGGLCMIHDLREIAYLNNICDQMGMDTITGGNLCAFAMEASEKGKILEKISFGDPDAVADLLMDIAFKRGIGRVLAEGIRHAAKIWGMEDTAIHVKGMEPPGYEPRVLKGMGLAYATSCRGACHLRSTFYKAELSGMIDKDEIEGKAKLFVDFEDRLTLHDVLIVCRFYRDMYMWDELSEILKITTGMDLGKKDLKELAARVVNLTRRFNIREGITRADDTLPERFFTEPLGDEGKVINRESFETMLSDYYRLRGWSEDGIPI